MYVRVKHKNALTNKYVTIGTSPFMDNFSMFRHIDCGFEHTQTTPLCVYEYSNKSTDNKFLQRFIGICFCFLLGID